MSFLKISDPLKRDSIVKEYLELKKNIRDNFLSERIGEQQLQTDLSKFYRPITETQKATAREITEGLKPIREGIEKLPEAIQPIGEATGEATEEEEDEEDEEEEEEDESVGEIARHYLNKQYRDITFGIRKEKGHHYIGNKHVIVDDNDIIIAKDGDRFKGTDGLWELITLREPVNFDKEDEDEYERLMVKTNALHREYDPSNPRPRGSMGKKWKNILGPIWYKKQGFSKEDAFRMTKDKNYRKRLIRKMRKIKYEYEGEGVVVIPSDPNALLERLDLLLASQEAGHTGVRNELVSICDELKRQGVLDTKTYKKLNSNIKKMIVAKRGFKKRYAYGGSGIFDTIASLLTRIFTSSAAKQIASSAMDVGKSVAKEGAKKALEAGKSAATDIGKKLVTKALTPKSKKILQKYTTAKPVTQDINTLIDGSAIAVQELVRKLNSGAGIKKI